MSPLPEPAKERFYGPYRGKVFDNRDPGLQMRLRVTVDSLFGSAPLGWALPCLSPADLLVGSPLPIGASVWVMFEEGDPEYPVWLGVWKI